MNMSESIANLTVTLTQPGQRVRYIEADLSRQRSRIEEINKEKTLLLKSVGVIDKATEIISAQGIGRIESVVTAGMRMVFGTDKVGLNVEKKETARGNSYQLVPYKDTPKGRVSGPAMDTFGGGVVNVIAFLLRMIMVKRFKRAKLLVLDEPFNNVAQKYLPQVSQLLKKLAHDQGYNIFLITHQPTLAAAADRTYEVSGLPGEPPVLTLKGE